jgi:phosphoenolpyruvate carboxylase
LHYVLSNVATCIAAADLGVMREYTELVEDAPVRERFWSEIVAEFERTRAMVEAIYGGPLADRRPNIHGSLDRRREPLRVLHRQQIDLLRQWRRRTAERDDRAAALLPHLLLTVNAIASGLGATG